MRELVREANAFLSGKSRAVKERAGRRDGEGLGRARFRARRGLSRPARGALGGPVAAGHQSAQRRGGRRVRRASGGRLHLRRGVLLPHRAELGQPRLFPEGRPLARGRRGARRVPGAVLRRQAGAALHPALARDRGPRAARRGADASRAATRSRSSVPQRGEKKELVDHALANAREALGRKLADTPSQQKLLAALGGDVRAAASRRAASRSTTTATSRASTRSAP